MEIGSFAINEENLQTRLNYSRVAKTAVEMALFGFTGILAQDVERSSLANVLPIIRGHLFDTFGGAFQSSYYKVFYRKPSIVRAVASGLVINSFQEVAQGLNILSGTFDPLDFAAFGLGGTLFWAFDRTAKAIYDSGMTMPLYSMLGIQDRRISLWGKILDDF